MLCAQETETTETTGISLWDLLPRPNPGLSQNLWRVGEIHTYNRLCSDADGLKPPLDTEIYMYAFNAGLDVCIKQA